MITVVENARVVRGRGRPIIGYEGTLADISKRKRAELQLYEEKEKAQVTLQSIGDAVHHGDADGRIEYLNPVAEELTGWTTTRRRAAPSPRSSRSSSESTQAADRQPDPALPLEGRVVELERAVAAGQPPRPGNLDPGLGGPDPRPQRAG